jgi:hypothetical protein
MKKFLFIGMATIGVVVLALVNINLNKNSNSSVITRLTLLNLEGNEQ